MRVDEADEGCHPPGPEPLWSESWYGDAVAPDGSLAAYVRLARLPNADGCTVVAAVAQPGEPSVVLARDGLPLPAPDDRAQVVFADGLRYAQACEQPLTRFTVALEGEGEAFADASAPLRGRHGAPVALSLQLSWQTDGIPDAWRRATRYEIPCRVSGQVDVGGRRLALEGPGQRDHSWGARDWWASDWTWVAVHLDDGTHVHAVAVESHPGFGVGYVQRGAELTAVTGAVTTSEVASDGLVRSAQLTLEPMGLQVALQSLASTALRLQADDGRVTHFPRAACRATLSDGRRGLGWAEWNRNQRA